jgi:hypothetical protein
MDAWTRAEALTVDRDGGTVLLLALPPGSTPESDAGPMPFHTARTRWRAGHPQGLGLEVAWKNGERSQVFGFDPADPEHARRLAHLARAAGTGVFLAGGPGARDRLAAALLRDHPSEILHNTVCAGELAPLPPEALNAAGD